MTDEKSEWTISDLGGLHAELSVLRAEVAHLRKALEEIAKKEGEFSMDPFEHCRNCVDNMAEIARAALTLGRERLET